MSNQTGLDLSTEYLGLKLKNPLVPSASPLSENLDSARKLEDAGASAIVMYSLFEEQVLNDQNRLDHFLEYGTHTFAEAMTYFPEPKSFGSIDGESYLNHLRKLKEALGIPVIASLNGISPGGWMNYAWKMEQAGADAIELNIFFIPADGDRTPTEIEEMYLSSVRQTKERIHIPLAVKVAPYFTSMSWMARRFEEAGADGLVLFNRFYQPDFNLDALEVTPALQLSRPGEGRASLHWIALLRDRLKISLAATTGIHTHLDALRALMAGADITMMASALLLHGPAHLAHVLTSMKKWMQEHEYSSVEQMKGSLSYKKVANPAAFQRANYMKTLRSYREERV